MKHILLCPHVLDYGGTQLSVHHWAKFLDRSKYRVSVLAMRRGGLSEKFEAHYSVYYDDMGYPNITDFIKRLKPDLVHACPPGGKPYDYIARAARLVPVTQTIMCPRRADNLDDVSLSIVPSKYVLSLQSHAGRVVHIDHPFDLSDYDPVFDKGHFGLPKDKIIVGSLGNNRRENDHFLKIARRFKAENVHFAIKVNLKPKYYLKHRLLLSKKRCTIINKYLTEDEKLSFFRSFDIFLYPTSNEAYGVVFLEAMSQKVPIISYNDTAMPEVIGPGGLLAPLNDTGKMSEHLQTLVLDGAKRREIGSAGYSLMKKRNAPQLIAKKYEACFEEVLKNS